MSLDGFIAGPNDVPGNALGDGGERLHALMFSGLTPSEHNEFFEPAERSREVFDKWIEDLGAIVTGRRTYDLVNEWEGTHPLGVPVFVLTHEAPETVPEGETTFTFVTDGIESALSQAMAAAGDNKVQVGAANVAQQYLRAGLLDEIQVHVVPVLLGAGVRLFDQLGDEPIELEQTRVIESTGVTHLRYRVVKRSDESKGVETDDGERVL